METREALRVRSVSTRRGRSGSATRASIQTKSASSASGAALLALFVGIEARVAEPLSQGQERLGHPCLDPDEEREQRRARGEERDRQRIAPARGLGVGEAEDDREQAGGDGGRAG